jgi:hypothetical protein
MAPAGGPFSDPAHTVARKQSTTYLLVLSPLPTLIERRYTRHLSTTRTQISARTPHNRPSPTGCHIVLAYRRNTTSSRRLKICGGTVAADHTRHVWLVPAKNQPDTARGQRGTYTHTNRCHTLFARQQCQAYTPTSTLRRFVAQEV